MINWDALFLKLLHSRASGGQDDYAISILLYPISQILIVTGNISLVLKSGRIRQKACAALEGNNGHVVIFAFSHPHEYVRKILQ